MSLTNGLSISWYLLLRVFSLKFLYSSLGINDLLLSRKEWMTLGTNIHMDFLFCRSCRENLSTGTFNFRLDVRRMNTFFQPAPPDNVVP